jgi:hypothetical protein
MEAWRYTPCILDFYACRRVASFSSVSSVSEKLHPGTPSIGSSVCHKGENNLLPLLEFEPRILGCTTHNESHYTWMKYFIVYLKTLLVADVVERIMSISLINNELVTMIRERLWPISKHYSGICLCGLRENTKML